MNIFDIETESESHFQYWGHKQDNSNHISKS